MPRVSTSPSLYLQIVGTARVTNDCGVVGSVYTDAIVAVPDGELSTVSLDIPIGASFDNWARPDVKSYTKPLKVADLACPTWGLKDSHDKDPYRYTTVGAPFNPIIVPPSQLISLDSEWLQCTSYPGVVWVGGDKGICQSLRNEIFDPPRQLTPVAALLPATETASITTAFFQHQATTFPAQPAGIGSPQLAANTNKPNIMTSDPKPSGVSNHDSFGLAQVSLALGKDHPVNVNKDPPVNADKDPPVNAEKDPPINVDKDPPVKVDIDPPVDADKSTPIDSGNRPIESTSPGSVGNSAQNPSADTRHQPAGSNQKNAGGQPNALEIPELVMPDANPLLDPKGNGAESSYQRLGQIIHNAFNGNGISNAPNPQATTIGLPRSASAVMVVAGLTAKIINPSVVALAGTTISEDGKPVTISDKVFSLLPSNKIVIGAKPDESHVFALPMSTPTTVAIAHQPINIINPSTIAIAGTKLSVGGDAKVISNTIFSLNSAGNFFAKPISTDSHLDSHLDSHIYALPASNSATVEIAEQLVTIINPSTVAIAGTTLSIGGEAKSMSNTMFSLNSAGNLVVDPIKIDSHTFSLPATGSTAVSVAGQLITVINPSTVAIAGTTLLIGGEVRSISNTMFSLNSAGNLVAEPIYDSHTFSLPATTSATVSVAGQLITIINPSTIAIAGTTLIAGGKPITRSGTTMSLSPSDKLIIGFDRPSIEGFTTVLSSGISSTFTLAGLTFTPTSKSGVVVDGQTIFPGAPELSISGQSISLDAHGTLIVHGKSSPVGEPPFSVFLIGLTAQSLPTNTADAAVDDIRLSRTLPAASSAVAQPTPRNTMSAMDSFTGAAQPRIRISTTLKVISSLTVLILIRMEIFK